MGFEGLLINYSLLGTKQLHKYYSNIKYIRNELFPHTALCLYIIFDLHSLLFKCAVSFSSRNSLTSLLINDFFLTWINACF